MKSGKMAAVCVIALLLCGCERATNLFASAEERINEAITPKGFPDEQARLQKTLVSLGQPPEQLQLAINAQLKVRALSCAEGYEPSWTDDADDIRAELTNHACFNEADAKLVNWLRWQRASLLLVAPPLRVPSKEMPLAIGASARIGTVRVAADAGVALLQMQDELQVVSLADGEVIATHTVRNFPNLGPLSPNGRVYILGGRDIATLHDSITGDELVALPDARAYGFYWLDARTAVYAGRSPGATFIDFASGTQVPFNVIRSQPADAVAIPGKPDLFLIVHTYGAAWVHADRASGELKLRVEDELSTQGLFAGGIGTLTADGRFYLTGFPTLSQIDIEARTSETPSVVPLKMHQRIVAGPGPDEALVSLSIPGGETTHYIYKPADKTARPLAETKGFVEDFVFQRNSGLLMHKEGNRLVRVDSLDAGDPLTLLDMSIEALEAQPEAPRASANNDSMWPLSDDTRASSAAPLPTNFVVAGLGVYKGKMRGRSGDEHPESIITVYVMPSTKPRVLVLASREPVLWRLSGTVQGLSGIYLSGVYASRVEGAPPNVPVKTIGKEYAHEPATFEYRALNQRVAAHAGKGMDSFQGAYEGTMFTVSP